jgi:hypothetical protein
MLDSKYVFTYNFYCVTAGVAQLEEQLTCNQQVAGSSPIAGSSSDIRRQKTDDPYGGVPEWLKGADCKSAVDDFVGSNPTPSTRLIKGYPYYL